MFSLTHAITQGNEWFALKPALEKSIEWQMGILIFMSILAALTFLVAVRISRRADNAYPWCLCLGAGLASFYEPLGDLFAHVTYHEVNQLALISAFGYHVPLWILPTYVVFFGASVLWLQSEIDRGVKLSRWIILFVLSLPSAWLFEIPLLRMGAINYYGDGQPVQVFGYPVWMAFANSATIFVVAAACSFLRRSPPFQEQPILFIPTFPMLVIGASGAAALPLGSAINSEASSVAIDVAAIVSMALASLYVWIAGRLMSATEISPWPE